MRHASINNCFRCGYLQTLVQLRSSLVLSPPLTQNPSKPCVAQFISWTGLGSGSRVPLGRQKVPREEAVNRSRHLRSSEIWSQSFQRLSQLTQRLGSRWLHAGHLL